MGSGRINPFPGTSAGFFPGGLDESEPFPKSRLIPGGWEFRGS